MLIYLFEDGDGRFDVELRRSEVLDGDLRGIRVVFFLSAIGAVLVYVCDMDCGKR